MAEGGWDQERFSTEGRSFEEAVRLVIAGGADPTDDLTDQELLEVWAETTAGVANGTIPTYGDKDSLREDLRRRLGR